MFLFGSLSLDVLKDVFIYGNKMLIKNVLIIEKTLFCKQCCANLLNMFFERIWEKHLKHTKQISFATHTYPTNI